MIDAFIFDAFQCEKWKKANQQCARQLFKVLISLSPAPLNKIWSLPRLICLSTLQGLLLRRRLLKAKYSFLDISTLNLVCVFLAIRQQISPKTIFILNRTPSMQSMPQKSTLSSEGGWVWFGCSYGGCIVWKRPRFSYQIWFRTWCTTFCFGSSSSQGSVATLERDFAGFGFLQLESDVSDSLISLSWAESCLSILRCDTVFSSEWCWPFPFSSASCGRAKRLSVCAELTWLCSKRLRFFLMLSRLLMFSPQYFLRKLQLELEDFINKILCNQYGGLQCIVLTVLRLRWEEEVRGVDGGRKVLGGVGVGLYFKMRKRNHRIHDYQTMGKKILCGQFADRLKNNFAVGDEQNNLILYGLVNSKPITVLSTQNNSNNVTAITSLTFTSNDDQIIVGSSRGLINIWDLNTLKINSTLKGHTIEVSVLACDRSSENLLASGSADTSVKLWDLRTKNAVLTYKTHRKRVNAITTTRARLLLSGGDDCNFNAYDLKMMKPFFSQELEAAVLCLDSSQQLSAAGCMDRLARIHDVESNKPVGCTKSETMPISSVAFHESNFLFTAGTDNLKVWDLSNDIMMTDNIESGSKGILHMAVSDRVQQIAFSGGGLSYHQCFLSDINFKGPYVFSNHSISYEKPERVEEAIERNNNIKRGNSNNPIALITNEKTKLMIGKRNDSLAKQLSDVAENVNDAISNIKRASEEFSRRRNDGLELQEMMGEEHAKFLQIMSQRARSIQGMLDLWMKGNLKALIQSLKSTDIYVVSDVLAQILRPSKVTISAEFGFIIAERAKEMINSKHLTLVKAGLEYMLQVVSLFKDEMVRLKTFGTDRGGVDLAREERLRRYDLLIEQYVEVYQSHRLKKLSEKKDEASRLAEQLSSELAFIFKKVFGTDYEL